MNAVVEAEPTAADLLAALERLEAALVSLHGSLVLATECAA
ncbi:hypothetical protein [Microbacterium saccharophilum]|nr:hypothetical protein [Microbacterium saccharophilum]